MHCHHQLVSCCMWREPLCNFAAMGIFLNMSENYGVCPHAHFPLLSCLQISGTCVQLIYKTQLNYSCKESNIVYRSPWCLLTCCWSDRLFSSSAERGWTDSDSILYVVVVAQTIFILQSYGFNMETNIRVMMSSEKMEGEFTVSVGVFNHHHDPLNISGRNISWFIITRCLFDSMSLSSLCFMVITTTFFVLLQWIQMHVFGMLCAQKYWSFSAEHV